MERATLVAVVALAALTALPAIAEAATVSSAGTSISYGAATGETNNVDVDDPGSTYTFAETPITAGTGCTQTNANLVTCSDSGIGGVVMQMGDMNDTASATGANEDPFLILGGPGDDTLTASAASDSIAGGPNGPAGDEISGSAGGSDTAITQGFCTEGIFVSINDVDDDGGCDGSPFTDDVHTDVENLQGSDLNDTLIGSSGSNGLRGLAGNDRLDGGDNGAVSDSFTGDSGIDRVVFGIIPGHTYACTSQPVSLDMDNSSDDDSCADAASDNNNVRPDIESVTGSTLGDTITGSCFANTFAGDAGTAEGSAGGDDTLIGDPAGCMAATTDGTEADFMGGGEGNDIFDGDGTGNGGFDTVTYGAPYVDSAAPGISITFDDVANDNDGFGNATENVNGDINRLIGSSLDDSMNAAAADQDVQLFGRLGNDLLTDGPFNDLLNGEGGTDTVSCPNGGTNVSLNNEAGSC